MTDKTYDELLNELDEYNARTKLATETYESRLVGMSDAIDRVDLALEDYTDTEQTMAFADSDRLKANSEAISFDGRMSRVIGTDAQFDYEVGIASTSGLFIWDSASTEDDDNVTILKSDLAETGRFKRIDEKIEYKKQTRNTDFQPIDASSSLSADPINGGWGILKVNGLGVASSIAGYNYAWGATATGEEWGSLKPPYGVVIGDSIAEGRPMQNGRLGGGVYDADKENTDGCPSVEIAKRTGCYWYNHGWRGQKSNEIVDRWNRDVLAMSDDIGDGIGARTLPEGTLPYAVWVNVGINDNWTGLEINKVSIKNNYIFMAESAKANGFVLIFNTIGPNGNEPGSLGYEKQVMMNEWLREEMPKRGAYVFEYRDWFTTDAVPNTVRVDLGHDDIHPNKAGHISMAQAMLKQTKAPIICTRIVAESRVDPDNFPPSWVDMTGVAVYSSDDETTKTQMSLIDGVGSIGRLPSPKTKDTVFKFNPNQFGVASSDAGWSGLSSVSCVFGSSPDEVPDKSFYCALSCTGGVWSITNSLGANVNKGVVALTQSATQLTLATNRPVAFVNSTPGINAAFTTSFQYSGSAPYPSKAFIIRLKNSSLSDINPSGVPDGTFIYVNGMML